MTDKTISIYWFFILFIITFAIVFLVYSLYGKPLDVRQMEGNLLLDKMADCLNIGGLIPNSIQKEEGIFLINEENVLSLCRFNFNTEEVYNWNNDQYFVSASLRKSENNVLSEKEYSFSAGNPNLELTSNIYGIDSKMKKFPLCVKRKMFSLGQDDVLYLITLSACVRKTEKNA